MLLQVAMSMNPSLFFALCLGYTAGDVLSCDQHVDLKTGSNSVIYSFVDWCTRHSFPELLALFSGVITFPFAIFVTYALIDNVCYEYSLGNAAAGILPGSWVADFCDFEIDGLVFCYYYNCPCKC